MNLRSTAVAAGLAISIVAGIWLWRIWPRYTPISSGYVLADFPRSGLRYIVDDPGIKRVGQRVLSYRVEGRVILGTVRRSLGHPEIQDFRLDMDTARVEYQPRAEIAHERGPSSAEPAAGGKAE